MAYNYVADIIGLSSFV